MAEGRGPSAGESRFDGTCKEFFRLEEELDLFEQTADGVHFWERVRFRVRKEIVQQLGLAGQAHTRLPPGLSTKASLARRALVNVFQHNPFLVGPRELAFFGSPRRKRREDGTWWDIYCDPVIEAVDNSYVYFEGAYLDGHLRPPRTSHIRYTDLVSFTAAVRKRVLLRGDPLTNQDRELIGAIEEELNTSFGTNLDVQCQVAQTLRMRQAVLPVYDIILRRIDPRLVLLVCGYGKENLLEACQNRGISTVELQHGVIDRYHLGYSFPGRAKKRLFADYLFTFGEYWAQQVDLPIEDDYVYVVGYPYFEEERERFRGESKKDQVLFISQGTIGHELSRLAVGLSQILDSEWHIVYKLHPGEYGRWAVEYPWLVEAEDIDVVTDSPPLYQLFAQSRVQVGVNSTALFEGLGFGLETYLAPLPGVARMNALWDRGYARLVSSAEELNASIAQGPTDRDLSADTFFASESRRRLPAAIGSLLA